MIDMELTDQQLKIVETQLKMLLPHSQQVYGCVILQNRGQCNSFKFLVDHWPEFNVIVCQPKFEQRGDLFKVTLIFAKEEASLKEIMHKTKINWTKYLCFGIDLCHEMVIMEVALEKNVSGRKVAVCHMMTLEDMSFLLPIDSSKVSVCSLNESHIALVNKTWTFGKGEDSVRMIQEMIINFPSCCVLDEESQQPVAWILMYTSCAMGMLYTLPGHRGKGYAKVLISSMAKKLHALGHPVYCFIEEENTVSLRLFKNMGFTEDPSYRAAWLAFNSL